MIQRKPGKRNCKVCKTRFEKDLSQPWKVWCSDECALEIVKQKKDKITKKLQAQYKQNAKAEKQEWQKEKKALKESLKPHSELLKDLQDVVNEFVRLRDRDLPCISCGTMNDVKYDAGHYYSRKGYSGIRFDEDNIHKQCSNHCNVHLSGNFAAYTVQLPRRIGQERFDALVARRHVELKISVPELKEKIIYYKEKISELKKAA